MGRGQRLGLILAAIAVAVVAFVLLQPSDSDDDSDTPRPAATTEQPTRGDEEPTATVEVPNPPPRVERIRVVDGEPADGVEKLTFDKGETVRLAVTSDVADHVHVHGYDLFSDVSPGATARFRFPADIEGVFEIELEDTHTPIAELVVEP